MNEPQIGNNVKKITCHTPYQQWRIDVRQYSRWRPAKEKRDLWRRSPQSRDDFLWPQRDSLSDAGLEDYDSMSFTTIGTNLLGQTLQRCPVHFQNDVPDLYLPTFCSWLPREELLHPHDSWSQLLWGKVIFTAETEPKAWAVLQELYLKCVVCKWNINLLFPTAHWPRTECLGLLFQTWQCAISPSHGSFTELNRHATYKTPPG